VDPLDRELASLLSVEPSPEFRARVRARVASEPSPRSWYLQWRAVSAGAATIAVAVAIVLGRADRPEKAPPLPSTALGALPVVIPAPHLAATAMSRPSRRREPEVVVAPGELRGLRQLAVLVREGRTQFVFPDDASAASREPVQDIVIAPIAIAPLDIAANADSGWHSEGDEQ
jgi:hypothetical protein